MPAPDFQQSVQSTVQGLMQAPTRRAMYAGNASVQRNPNFFAIPSLDDAPRKRIKGMVFEPASPPLVKNSRPRQVRGGHMDGFGDGTDPLYQRPLDSHALRALKIRDPVAYHAYTNPRPWVTQSTTVGEFTRKEQPPRVPLTAPVGSTKREALRALRLASDVAVGASRRQAAMDDVSPTREGYRASPPRHDDDMTTTAQRSFVNPKSLPEPPSTRPPEFFDRPFYTKHPVDLEPLQALESMRNFDGTLVSERPDKVHPSIWLRESQRERSLALNNPHAHKQRRPLSSTRAGSFSASRTVPLMPSPFSSQQPLTARA